MTLVVTHFFVFMCGMWAAAALLNVSERYQGHVAGGMALATAAAAILGLAVVAL